MKTWGLAREILLHLVVTAAFAAIVILLKGYLLNTQVLISFIVGSALGMFLPDVDYLVYAFYLRPVDLTSQRIAQKVNEKQYGQSISLLYETRLERKELIFHSAFFQVIFIVFAFLIVTSSASFLGRGLVLAFLLHLFTDEICDLRLRGNISRWFTRIPFTFTDKQIKLYVYGQLIPIILLGIFF